jgi:hypothetical protein
MATDNDQTEILHRIERRIQFIGMLIIVSIAIVATHQAEASLPEGWVSVKTWQDG